MKTPKQSEVLILKLGHYFFTTLLCQSQEIVIFSMHPISLLTDI